MENNNQDFLKEKNITLFYYGEFAYFILTLIQLSFMAFFFGASLELDSFLIAFIVPHFFMISLEGIVRGGFIPKFLELKKDYDEYTSWRFFWQNILVITLFSIAVMVVFIILGPLFFSILSMGLKGGSVSVIIKMFSYLMLGVIFANINTVIREVYFSESDYKKPVIGKFIHIIILIVFITGYSDEIGIYSLVFGYLTGYIFETLYLIAPIRDKFAYASEIFSFYKSPALKNTLKNSVPFILTAVFLYVDIIVDRFIAGFGKFEGTISSLNYAFSLSFKLSTIFLLPTIWIFYPRIIKAAKELNDSKLHDTLTQAINAVLFFMIPLSVLLILARNEFVAVFFFRGSFNVLSYTLTRNALLGYAFNLPFFAINSMLILVFYSQGKVKPLINPLVASVITNFFLDIILFSIFGIFGIAFATSIVQFSLMINLLKLLRYSSGIRIQARNLPDLKKVIYSTVIMIVLSIILFVSSEKIIGDSMNDHALRLIFLVFECGAIYYLISRMFKVETPDSLFGEIRPNIK
ncbi:MAG: lipid II flippase MurJ [bacterium]|nr:lipid II flippase MurJ [bacterium]